MTAIDRSLAGDADMPTIVDPLTFPLHGSSLIEASAGTGKTYTIAALYLRLVLGHGISSAAPDAVTTNPSASHGTAFVRALTPPEILVVTFTDAATKELRDRIRIRLAEASAYFFQSAEHREGSEPGALSGRLFDDDTDDTDDGYVGYDNDADDTDDSYVDDGGYDVDRGFGHAHGGIVDNTVVPRNASDMLVALRDDYPPDEWSMCGRKLQLAAEWMDEAAVSTIHGWCNRMLREHAFDSDSLFTQRLETDQSDMLAEVVRDYWRTFLYPLPAADVAVMSQWWTTPEMLQHQLSKLLGHLSTLDQGRAPTVAIADARDAAMRELATIKAPWSDWIDTLEGLFDAAVAAKQVDGRKMQKRYYGPWFDALREWCTTPAQVAPAFKTDTAWERLCPDGIAEVWKEGFAPPTHPALEAMTTLRERLAALPSARDDVLQHATHWVAARFDLEQQTRAQMGFDDLLTRLDQALQGPNGARLAEIIRQQFPVALIDEFQDTDPLQYRIFDTIYQLARNASDRALILIGDPKQAIYAFRGADIYTYLSARRDTAGRHYTLGTNYRSTRDMVVATNHCFEQAETRAEGEGAFLFRRQHDNPLPFLPVQAKGRDSKWLIDGHPAPALTAWYQDDDADKATGKAHYIHHFSAVCADEIVRLLTLGQQRRAGFGTSGMSRPSSDAASDDASELAFAASHETSFVAVAPGDIAVLVNTGAEAKAVRRALSVRHVRSVYLSDKESVFQSASAAELQRWLAACAEPDNDRLLRAALATPALGLQWAELDRLNHDELAWEGRVIQFRQYRQCWRRQGVLPMLRRLLNDFAVPRRLLSAGRERELTDLLHLAELLQQASVLLDGEHALIRHLAEQRDDAGDENDVRKLRLESDADLVKVVTVHKSKGLEYPLVFLPFACGFRAAKAGDLPLTWHDDAHRLHVSLSADDVALERADRERLGEDLRKLYVALTRARFATWIGMAPIEDLHRSALGYLLSGGRSIVPGALEATLRAFQGDCHDMAIVCKPGVGAASHLSATPAQGGSADEDDALTPASATERGVAPESADGVVRFAMQTTAPALSPERDRRPTPREPWWIASYSALQTGAVSEIDAIDDIPAVDDIADRTPDTAAQDTFIEASDARDPLAPIALESLHGFPRGPHPGSFLHGLLEWAGERGFGEIAQARNGEVDEDHENTENIENIENAARRDEVLDVIARRCQVRGWERWIAPLSRWLPEWLNTPLRLSTDSEATVRLAALRGYQIEMEFWFAVHAVPTRQLDRLVSAQTLGGVARPTLLPNQLNGMLKGFIDLVFEHEGRYYVADYKSNWLGPTDDDYSRPAMQAAVLEKRYDVQYVLYLFALHRLLRSRLPDYDYDKHVGGAVYMFLRGTQSSTQGLFCDKPPRSLIDRLDTLFSASVSGADRQEDGDA